LKSKGGITALKIRLLPYFIEPQNYKDELLNKLQDQVNDLLNQSIYQVEMNLQKLIEQLLQEELTDETIPFVKELLIEQGYILNINVHVIFKPEEKYEFTARVYKLEKEVLLNKLTGV
jgi:hypothetical protein